MTTETTTLPASTPAVKRTDNSSRERRPLAGTHEDYRTWPFQSARVETVPDVWGGESPQLVVNKHLLAGLRLLIRAHAAEPGGEVRYKHRREDRRLGAALEALGFGTCGMAGGGRGSFAIAPRGREVLLAATAALGPLLSIMQKQRKERRERRERARAEREREIAALFERAAHAAGP